MSKSRSSSKKKIKLLYLTSEVDPFLHISAAAEWVKNIVQQSDESQDYEIRIIMPKFGVINERTNSLHEVKRLSGINISVREEEISLVVKVGTLKPTRVQVYFLDNEYLFQRKGIFKNEEGEFYDDNHDRLIFINKSVLAVLEYLQWMPKLVHCVGWLWALFPMYTKSLYKKGSPFAKAKYIYTHDDTQFQPGIDQSIFYDFNHENGSPTLEDFYRIAAEYSDYTSKLSEEKAHALPNIATEEASSESSDDASASTPCLAIYKNLLGE